MVLVDTSVWVEHFRKGRTGLEPLLSNGRVVSHPFVVGELACGNLKNRSVILSLIRTLPMALIAEHEEIMSFIENYRLMGKGLGYIDMHLLASAMLTNLSFWTFDKRLNAASASLGVEFRSSDIE